MVRNPGRTAPLPPSAEAPQELSAAEMNTIVGGNARQATTAGSPKEQVSFAYGSLILHY